jgi:hypothetical protein
MNIMFNEKEHNMKRSKRGIHIFGIEDGDVVVEIWAQPDDETEALLVEIRRDHDVPLSTVVDIVQGVGRSLWRLANNPATIEVIEAYDEFEIIKGEPPF